MRRRKMNCVPLSWLFGAASCLRSLFIQNVCLYFAAGSNVDSSQISFGQFQDRTIEWSLTRVRFLAGRLIKSLVRLQ